MNQLTYVLINPYIIYKSRTGSVISRLLSRSTNMHIVGARMFAPSQELVDDYLDALNYDHKDGDTNRIDGFIYDYVKKRYAPSSDGSKRRVMLLLLEGENAIEELKENVVGAIIRENVGETIRDTFGDYIENENGDVIYFEPAVLIPRTVESAKKHIDVWMKHADNDSGILENVAFPKNADVQKTLVMIKPDTLAQSRTRTGAVIDIFAKTGLKIIAIKIIHMTVAQAMEFYGPVRQFFINKFADKVGDKVNRALSNAFEFDIPAETVEMVKEQLKVKNADNEFGKIVNFITGCDPWNTPESEWSTASKETCIALVYQGENAIEKIRNQLGSTDPNKAAPATVRKEFGQNVMVNTAHASDSPENAEREMGILKIAENDLVEIVTR
ncbi:MAG: nucleoside-diphosphate kinase [Chlamydiae bacterium]|nr:MAG: nucleoside-diphosphate kinase [Chlamydiota bacterium]